MAIEVVNPATDERVAEYAETTPEEVAQAIARAEETLGHWRRSSLDERSRLMTRAAAVLRSRAGEYAVVMAQEMGKPIRQGRAEVEKCAWVCDYYAEKAVEFLAPEPIETDARSSFVCFQPLGVLLAVMPWNFPFWQVFRFAAPSLMAGNTALLKHASNVPGCALAIEGVFREAGFPEGAFTTLLIPGRAVADVIADPRIRGVTLTGSTEAGISVGECGGHHLKKTVLELGGSDPYIILEDADLPAAAAECVSGRLINSGQSCIAAKRFVVVENVHDEFLKLVVNGMAKAKVGSPMEEDTDVGPLARRDLRDEVHEQVEGSLSAGAQLLLGGDIPDGPGAYYQPTVLADVGPRMPAYEEEVFGPVAAVIRVRDEAEAIRVANDSVFGLGAAVFTQDLERGQRIAAEELDAGCCFVNAFVRSDPRLPFGGVKQSGYGRELSHYGIREFVNVKTVYVA